MVHGVVIHIQHAIILQQSAYDCLHVNQFESTLTLSQSDLMSIKKSLCKYDGPI